MFLPLLPVVLGALFIHIALRDRPGRKQNQSVRVLPTPKEQPLYYVHTSLRSAKRPPKPAEKDQRERKPRPRGRPRILKQV